MTEDAKGLTRKDLDGMTCQNPECDHTAHNGPLALTGRCHPGHAVHALYQDGQLFIVCAECETTITRVEVAAE